MEGFNSKNATGIDTNPPRLIKVAGDFFDSIFNLIYQF